MLSDCCLPNIIGNLINLLNDPIVILTAISLPDLKVIPSPFYACVKLRTFTCLFTNQ